MMQTAEPLLYVDGRWVGSDAVFSVLNPATGHELARVPLGDATLLETANRAAHSAFCKHRHTESWQRSDWLRALAAALEERAERFAVLITAEAGKPISLARLEVARAVATFTFAAEEARRQQGSLLDLDALPSGTGHFGFSRRFPLGVVAALTPFNFPLNLVAHKVAPALAAGNSVVLKPSPHTPLTALLLAEAAEAADLPRGLLNVVTCSNAQVVPWLADARLRMISFTGSGPVGRALHAHAAGRRCTLELGGNAAVIVHADAQLEEAIPLIARGAFAYSGQSCISVQRVLVQESRYAELRERLLSYTREHIRLGDPTDSEVLLGPMISTEAALRTETAVAQALVQGARLLAGGERRDAFFSPTLLEGALPSAQVMCEELFAPILCLASYRTFDAALAMVNDSAYGLQAGVFTQDFPLAWKAFRQLETGAVLINQVPTWRADNMPYGGVKGSGLGREGVRSAMDDMTEPRSWIWNGADSR